MLQKRNVIIALGVFTAGLLVLGFVDMGGWLKAFVVGVVIIASMVLPSDGWGR